MQTYQKHLADGSTLHSYTIKRFISSGGFGNTYEAVHNVFGTRVAIKELFISEICSRSGEQSRQVQVSTSDGKEVFDRHKAKFIKEAQRLYGFSHPGIVKVSDVFEANGTAYYVMDYINGGSLADKLKTGNGRLSEKATIYYLRKVIDALEYVHDRGLLHLDIKPENIMVDDKDNTILIDFGASKMIEKIDGESTSSSLTCTPGYAPSELMEQKMSNFGAWTDIYSLGATLFKLLTGNQPPTPGDINEDGLPTMPGISTPMVNLVTKMMKPVRKQRPQSIADLRVLVDSLSDNIADSQKSPKTQIIDNVDTSNKTIPLTDKGKSSTTGKPGHIKLRPILIGLGIVSLIVIGYNLFPDNTSEQPIISLDEAINTSNIEQLHIYSALDSTRAHMPLALYYKSQNSDDVYTYAWRAYDDGQDTTMCKELLLDIDSKVAMIDDIVNNLPSDGNAIVDQLEKAINIRRDTESLAAELGLYYKFKHSKLDQLVDKYYKQWMRAGDASPIPEVKENCYNTARRLKP